MKSNTDASPTYASEQDLVKKGDTQTRQKEKNNEREMDFRGSVIEDKVNETLESFLKAFEARVTKETPLPPKLQEYPNPIQEKINLVRNQALICDTQTMFEGPPPYHTPPIVILKPTLETIPKVSVREILALQTTRGCKARLNYGEK